MNIVKNNIQYAFDRAAKHYRKAASVYEEIGKRLLERLDYLNCAPKLILDAGCGLGNFSKALSERYPEASVVGLDLSWNMLSGFAEYSDTPGLMPVQGDMEQLPLQSETMDMIFVNQSISNITDTQALFREFYRVLKKDGVLFFSTLGPDSLIELKTAWASADDYAHVSDFKDLHHLGDELLKEHFIQPVMDMEYLFVHYSGAEQVLKDLRQQGSYNTHPKRCLGLTGKKRLQQVLSTLEGQHEFQKIPLTYEVIYGHAWRGEKPFSYYDDVHQETVIPVERLRR